MHPLCWFFIVFKLYLKECEDGWPERRTVSLWSLKMHRKSQCSQNWSALTNSSFFACMLHCSTLVNNFVCVQFTSPCTHFLLIMLADTALPPLLSILRILCKWHKKFNQVTDAVWEYNNVSRRFLWVQLNGPQYWADTSISIDAALDSAVLLSRISRG